MNTKLMDECFNARMVVLNKRLPISKFRELFVKEFARMGIVYLQCTLVESIKPEVMEVWTDCGFVFAEQRHLDSVVRLLRRWGFVVELRSDRKQPGKKAYAVMLPYEYLRNKLSSNSVGQRTTALRNLRCWMESQKEHSETTNCTN